MTAKLVLILALCALPGPASADMLHILDKGIANFHPSSTTWVAQDSHVIWKQSTLPGSDWEFFFGFIKSSDTYQWTVDVTAEIDAGKAGHSHREPPPRLYYYPNWPDTGIIARFDGATVRSPQLDQDQYFHVHMAPVNYAAGLKVVGTFTQLYHGRTYNPTLTHFLDVRTPGLTPLPANDRLYKLTGATAAHPENHYGSTTTVAALMSLAGAWKNTHPSSPPIEMGNISLPRGGAFDVKGDWKADNMHHAYGIAADIGKGNFTSGERDALLKLLCGNGFYVYNRAEDGVERYHAVHREEFRTLKRLAWPVGLPAKAEGAVNCCSASTGSPAWRKCVALPRARK